MRLQHRDDLPPLVWLGTAQRWLRGEVIAPGSSVLQSAAEASDFIAPGVKIFTAYNPGIPRLFGQFPQISLRPTRGLRRIICQMFSRSSSDGKVQPLVVPVVVDVSCDACLGTGRHAHFPARTCGYCAGTGRQEADTP